MLTLIRQDGTSLFIHDVTERDDGEYTCEVETKVKKSELKEYFREPKKLTKPNSSYTYMYSK